MIGRRPKVAERSQQVTAMVMIKNRTKETGGMIYGFVPTSIFAIISFLFPPLVETAGKTQDYAWPERHDFCMLAR